MTMQGSKMFEEVIWNYLLERAEEDERIAKNLEKENKSIRGCVNFIFEEVKKSDKNGFDDSEIFSMAIHYYDEDDIVEVTTQPKGRVVVNIPPPKKKAKGSLTPTSLFGDDESQD